MMVAPRFYVDGMCFFLIFVSFVSCFYDSMFFGFLLDVVIIVLMLLFNIKG